MLRFDPSALEWRSAAGATGAILVAIALAIAVDGYAGAGGVALVLTLMAFPGATRTSMAGPVAFAAAGCLVAFLAASAAGRPWAIALLIGGVVYASERLTPLGTPTGHRGTLITVWALFVVSQTASPVSLVVSYGAGSALAVLILLLKTAHSTPPTSLPTSVGKDTHGFALVKALVASASIPMGLVLFPAFPYWITLTVVIVAHGRREATLTRALQRAVGTGLGVAAGVILVRLLPDEGLAWNAALIVLVLGQILFMRVNYVLYAGFLTALLLVAQLRLGQDPAEVGWMRLVSTLTGVAIALGLVAWYEEAARRAGVGRTQTVP